ncbi:multiple epidermal growth factor-like domains protein 9 [Anguilla anguilla]|uniref:multiple epidermal growth factor-like domains protein 9 n=1 Tax=Anguilla anguilla TaxID=7936 RepID=UPI0015A8DEE6|nr:multiple epidermal growth factor-like domains protein 9 [Anguilla anguilla]
MKCTPLMMFLSPALELVLFVCVWLSEAAPSASTNDATALWRERPDVSETILDLLNTTMPNHLQEDRLGIVTFSALTPAPTTVSPRASGKTAQLQTTTAQITKTVQKAMEPTTKTGGIVMTTSKQKMDLVNLSQTTVTATANSISSVFPVVKTASPTSATVIHDRTTTSWSPKSTTVPPLTPTTENRQDILCNCTGEGVEDLYDCDVATGQCRCLPGYVGPQCEDCEDGHFTNGSTSCQPCGCDSFGSFDHRCDSSGTCVCKIGVYGPKCDECQPGYFHFSNTGCQPCQCNNHSSYCHPQSGICLNCQGSTKGPSCEECKYNFYRRPDAALTDSCLPCPCSTVTSTGTCHIESSGRAVCDQCRPEYEGPNCDKCRDGYYNSDSICLPCECNGNGDPATFPRLCDPDTGHCLSCVNSTAGPHCQLCASGFSGDALNHTCTPADVKTLPAPELTIAATTPPSATSTSTAVPPIGTMTSMANSTSLRTAATTQALLTSLGSPTDNTTATVTEVSWTQFNIIILAVIIVVVVLLMGFVGGVYTYREYQNRKLNAPFWTIELKEDNISFSSYHDSIPNADVSGLLEDEATEVAPNGQLALSTPMNMYKA